jgi:hypothetical protein
MACVSSALICGSHTALVLTAIRMHECNLHNITTLLQLMLRCINALAVAYVVWAYVCEMHVHV